MPTQRPAASSASDANANASQSWDQITATVTADGGQSQPTASNKTANARRSDMRSGRTMQHSVEISKPIHYNQTQREKICRALFEIVEDKQAPASARAAAARTLLDDLNRNGNSSEKSLSAMSVEAIEAELSVGAAVGGKAYPAVTRRKGKKMKPNNINGL